MIYLWKDGQDTPCPALTLLTATDAALQTAVSGFDYGTVVLEFPCGEEGSSLRRETGYYEWGSAVAELTLNGSAEKYRLEVRFTSLEHGRELAQKIRGGNIRPTIGYEGKQKSKVRLQAEKLLADFWKPQ